jgi:hypothetical protein
MKKLMSTIALILLLATTVLLPAGCAKEPEIVPSESNRWLELLRVLPANENTLKAAYLQDNAYMLEKITQPEYAVGHNLPMFGSAPGSYSDEEWKATLGFVAADVDQTIYAGSAPPRYYEALKGRFNQNDVDNATRTGPMNEMLGVVSYAGHEFYSWGEDFGVNLAMRSNVRPLGRGHRLALVDDFIFWMLWTDGIEEMIDSYEGNIASLADNEDYRLLAGGLEELDTVTAFFSSEPQSESHFKEVHQQQLEEIEPETREVLLGELERDIKLKPYLALATGAGKDEKGYYLAVALANADEETARQNVKLLEQRLNQSRRVWGPRPRNGGELWSDFIENMSIESRGRLTLAKVYGPIVEYWDRFEMSSPWGPYEPLLLHE